MTSKATEVHRTPVAGPSDQSTSGSTKRWKPDHMHVVTPHLVCDSTADAIEFYKKAFLAEEVCRIPGPGDKLIHAEIRIGGSTVMLMDEFPDMGSVSPRTLRGSPVTIHLFVEDVDAFVARAISAGATITMPVQDMFWGDRYGSIDDPFGHHWSVATQIREMSPEEIQEAAKTMCG